jgi:hypothetical protein
MTKSWHSSMAPLSRQVSFNHFLSPIFKAFVSSYTVIQAVEETSESVCGALELIKESSQVHTSSSHHYPGYKLQNTTL